MWCLLRLIKSLSCSRIPILMLSWMRLVARSLFRTGVTFKLTSSSNLRILDLKSKVSGADSTWICIKPVKIVSDPCHLNTLTTLSKCTFMTILAIFHLHTLTEATLKLLWIWNPDILSAVVGKMIGTRVIVCPPASTFPSQSSPPTNSNLKSPTTTTTTSWWPRTTLSKLCYQWVPPISKCTCLSTLSWLPKVFSIRRWTSSAPLWWQSRTKTHSACSTKMLN